MVRKENVRPVDLDSFVVSLRLGIIQQEWSIFISGLHWWNGHWSELDLVICFVQQTNSPWINRSPCSPLAPSGVDIRWWSYRRIICCSLWTSFWRSSEDNNLLVLPIIVTHILKYLRRIEMRDKHSSGPHDTSPWLLFDRWHLLISASGSFSSFAVSHLVDHLISSLHTFQRIHRDRLEIGTILDTEHLSLSLMAPFQCERSTLSMSLMIRNALLV